MSIIKPNNNTISAITALPAAIPTGKVLQVVNNTFSTAVTTTSSTYSDTGISLAITPSATSSKIVVMFTDWIRHQTGGQIYMGGNYAIVRGSTVVWQGDPTTTEKLGFIGRKEGIAVLSTISVIVPFK